MMKKLIQMFQNAKDEKKIGQMEPEQKKSQAETKYAPTGMNSRSTSSFQSIRPPSILHHPSPSREFTSGGNSTGRVGPTVSMGYVGSTDIAGPVGLIYGHTGSSSNQFYSQNYLRYCPENTDDQGNLIENDHSCPRCFIHNSLNSQSNLNREVWERKRKHQMLEQTSRYVIAMVLLESWCLPEMLFSEMSKDLRLLLLYPT